MFSLLQQTAVIHDALEHGRLPLVVLALLLVGMFGTIAYAIAQFTKVLRILNGPPPFPTHAFTTTGGMLAFLGMVIIAMCRAALGMEWPDGYDFVLGTILSVVLGVAAWGVGKRLTDERYVAAKAAGAAQHPTVNVEGDATVTQQHAMPRPAGSVRATDTLSGAAPDDGAVG